MHVFVDADACPVKEEVYRVAGRHRLPVTLVANSWIRVPMSDRIRLEVVHGDLDAADDRIVEQVAPHDVVVTADIPLASRCLKEGALVLTPTGKRFTDDNIGDAVATRDLLADLRSAGATTGGPPPFGKRERSRFLQVLEEVIQSAKRAAAGRWDWFGTFDRQVTGQKVFDINVDWLAHIGLLPDMMADLKQIGLADQHLEPLLQSANRYLEVWEAARNETCELPVPDNTIFSDSFE